MTWTLTVLGKPATKGSTVSFLSRRGKVITRTDSARLVPWTDAVRWACREQGVRVAAKDQPVYLAIDVTVPTPKGTKRMYPVTRPDVDKWARAALDALTGMAYEDDSQVVHLAVGKAYGSAWSTVVRIMSGEEHEW